MKLLGYATGRIYEIESLDEREKIQECCHMLSNYELDEIENDSMELDVLRGLYRLHCKACQMVNHLYAYDGEKCLIYRSEEDI